jgi:hypothetical protein
MSEDSSRAAWLQQARSYLRNAYPVLAQLPPMDLYRALLFQVTGQQLSVPTTRRTLARIQALSGVSPHPPNCWPSTPASSARPACPGGRSARCATWPSG